MGSPGPSGGRASLVGTDPTLAVSVRPGFAGLRGGVSARGQSRWRAQMVRTALPGGVEGGARWTCRQQTQASPEPKARKTRMASAPRAVRVRRPLQPAELRVLREHSMPQGGAETPHSRPESREIHYIHCILPDGTLGAVLRMAVLGAEGRTGPKGSRRNQAQLGCVRARGSLKGKKK